RRGQGLELTISRRTLVAESVQARYYRFRSVERKLPRSAGPFPEGPAVCRPSMPERIVPQHAHAASRHFPPGGPGDRYRRRRSRGRPEGGGAGAPRRLPPGATGHRFPGSVRWVEAVQPELRPLPRRGCPGDHHRAAPHHVAQARRSDQYQGALHADRVRRATRKGDASLVRAGHGDPDDRKDLLLREGPQRRQGRARPTSRETRRLTALAAPRAPGRCRGPLHFHRRGDGRSGQAYVPDIGLGRAGRGPGHHSAGDPMRSNRGCRLIVLAVLALPGRAYAAPAEATAVAPSATPVDTPTVRLDMAALKQRLESGGSDGPD